MGSLTRRSQRSVGLRTPIRQAVQFFQSRIWKLLQERPPRVLPNRQISFFKSTIRTSISRETIRQGSGSSLPGFSGARSSCPCQRATRHRPNWNCDPTGRIGTRLSRYSGRRRCHGWFNDLPTLRSERTERVGANMPRTRPRGTSWAQLITTWS